MGPFKDKSDSDTAVLRVSFLLEVLFVKSQNVHITKHSREGRILVATVLFPVESGLLWSEADGGQDWLNQVHTVFQVEAFPIV